MPYHLRLVSALLGPVYRVRESGGHSPGAGHRVDPPCLLSARGAHYRVARLRERTPLFEGSATLTKKLVVRHSISSPTLLNSDSRRDSTYGYGLARGFSVGDTWASNSSSGRAWEWPSGFSASGQTAARPSGAEQAMVGAGSSCSTTAECLIPKPGRGGGLAVW
jgi:hypothetical protein